MADRGGVGRVAIKNASSSLDEEDVYVDAVARQSQIASEDDSEVEMGVLELLTTDDEYDDDDDPSLTSSRSSISQLQQEVSVTSSMTTTKLAHTSETTAPPTQPQQQQGLRCGGVGDVDSTTGAVGIPAKKSFVGKKNRRNNELGSGPYDLTSIVAPAATDNKHLPSYTIDPWETGSATPDAGARKGSPHRHRVLNRLMGSPGRRQVVAPDDSTTGRGGGDADDKRSTFILPGDIHPNMEHREEEIARLRLLAGRLSVDWKAPDFMAPALARRIRDFQFAQEKRRKKYGDERPWGILGLYDHLASIRIDVEWAEDAATRRANGDSYQSWADFDESKKGGSNRPYFTYALLLISLVLMIASIAVNQWQVEPIEDNPMVGPSAETLIAMGAKDADLIVNNNEWWRLFTSTVLHAGLVHYIINMLALYFVGIAIETTHGFTAAMIIFCLSAVGGTVLSALFLPEYITVGASGGIFGFIGACLADILMNWKLLFCDFVTENGKKHHHAMVVVVLILDIFVNSIIGLTPYIDNFTHLGGMLFGLLCGLSTIERLSTDFFGLEEEWTTRAKHFCMRCSGLILSVFSLIITMIILFQGDGESTPCSACKAISCVPFPPWAGPGEQWWHCDDCGSVTAELISYPTLRLELACPNKNAIATVDLSHIDEDDVDKNELQRNLPKYCREYCPPLYDKTDTQN